MATNAVYGKSGTAITFKATGGDVTFTPNSIANGAGRVSAQLDLGVLGTARPERYSWIAQTQCQATPTVNSLVRMYFSFFDSAGTDAEGGTGTADAAFSTENNLLNCHYFGNIVVRAAAANTKFTKAGELWLPAGVRYVSLIWWNATGASLTTDSTEHYFTMTPLFPDIQAAA